MTWLSSILEIVAGWIKWQGNREERLNSPEIKNNEAAKRDAELKDEAVKIVEKASKTGDLDEIRKASAD